MAHRINFVGQTSDQRKLENIYLLFDHSKLPVFDQYPIDFKIYAESDVFTITVSIRNDTGVVGTMNYLKTIQDLVLDFFPDHKIEYFFNEEVYCEFPMVDDIEKCMESCGYKVGNAFPINCRGLQFLTICRIPHKLTKSLA